MTNPLVSVHNLRIELETHLGTFRAVDDVSFEIYPGEILGLVGESGAGKSLTGKALIGLLESPLKVIGGTVFFEGNRIDNLPYKKLRKIRGQKMGMIFQDPMTSLDPLFKVGDQLVETIRTHQKMSRKEALERAVSLLDEVGIPSPNDRINQYPHQFSGGMRQRVVIALALSANPRLLIADEPTTALDVLVQSQIIHLLKKLCRTHNMSVLLITHDMGVISEIADRVAVMYSGSVMEVGDTDHVIRQAQHPYTEALMQSIPSMSGKESELKQINGIMPGLANRVSGCLFRPRCEKVDSSCLDEAPELQKVNETSVACWKHRKEMNHG